SDMSCHCDVRDLPSFPTRRSSDLGNLAMVNEKINGNRFPELRPTKKIKMYAKKELGDTIVNTMAPMVSKEDHNKNFKLSTFESSMAPVNLLIISAKK